MRRRRKLANSALATLALLLIGCIVVMIVGYNYITDKDEQIAALTGEMEANKQVLYVASQFIGQGETIEEGVNVMLQEVYTGLEDYNYITEEDLGCLAAVDIEEKMPIMRNMTAPVLIGHDTREYEMRVVNLPLDQQENDIVDVRIMFPTGEDFVVLAKKQVKGLSMDTATFTLDLSEEEIVRMASATIDAFTVTGTRIYTTRYVESNLQDASTPNYLVRQETIDLVNSDPNILSKAQETLNKFARLELEERLSGLASEALTAANDGHGMTDYAAGQALLGRDGNSPAAQSTQTESSYETEAEIQSKMEGH